ncbi:hypothetical protein ABVT39_010912, partial [Epinephelus coioides]
EATVPNMTENIKNELWIQENIVLCDGQGNRLVQSSRTTGIAFWKPNARKIIALNESPFNDLQRRKRRRTNLIEDETKEKLEELLLAAEELPAITHSLRDLGQYVRANKVSTVAL